MPEILEYILIGFLLWLLLLVGSLYRLRNAIRAAFWPELNGELEFVEVLRSASLEYVAYELNLRYRFDCNGAEYTGNTFSFRVAEFVSESSALNHLKPYVSREAIKVRYNPADPSINVIESGISFSEIRFLIISLFLSLTIFVGAYFIEAF